MDAVKQTPMVVFYLEAEFFKWVNGRLVKLGEEKPAQAGYWYPTYPKLRRPLHQLPQHWKD